MRPSAHAATPALLRQHVALLCDRHRIELRQSTIAKASHVDRFIAVPPVVDPRTYAIALHEIGHLVIGPYCGQLIDEAAAWTWVRDHALLWTPTMETTLSRSLASYLVA